MKSEYKRVVTQASAEMLARWILKNLDWSGGNDEANGAFLTSILLEHRKQASTPTPEARECKKCDYPNCYCTTAAVVHPQEKP